MAEQPQTAMLLYKTEWPMNAALRTTYADCLVHESGLYLVYRAFPDCQGRGPDLAAEWRQAR